MENLYFIILCVQLFIGKLMLNQIFHCGMLILIWKESEELLKRQSIK